MRHKILAIWPICGLRSKPADSAFVILVTAVLSKEGGEWIDRGLLPATAAGNRHRLLLFPLLLLLLRLLLLLLAPFIRAITRCCRGMRHGGKWFPAGLAHLNPKLRELAGEAAADGTAVELLEGDLALELIVKPRTFTFIIRTLENMHD